MLSSRLLNKMASAAHMRCYGAANPLPGKICIVLCDADKLRNYKSPHSNKRHVHTTSVLCNAAAAAQGNAPSTSSPRIGFIGAGQMGEALIRGFISSGISSAGKMSASVRTFERRELLQNLGIGNVFDDSETGTGCKDVANVSDIVFLGVKPQVLPPILQQLAPHVTPNHLIISIAAGVKLSTLESVLGSEARVIRVMPNTPCLVQCGASAYALGTNATPADAEVVHWLLSSVGLAVQVEEKMLDAVTGLSGSGPAFVYIMIEALADGGVAAGLPRDTALALAARTVMGSAKMVLGEDESSVNGLVHPGILKDKVASPSGTTIAGIMELEQGAFRGTVMKAVKAAATRSSELG